MKSILITLFISAVNLSLFGQGFSDIIKIEGEYYLIAPSLSIPQDNGAVYKMAMNNEHRSLYKAEYEIINDSIKLVEKLNDKVSSVLLSNNTVDFNPKKITGNYAISGIDNVERTRQELRNTKDIYIGDCCIDYTYVEFLDGVLDEDSYIHNSKEIDKAYVSIVNYYGYNYNVKLYSFETNELLYQFNDYQFWYSGHMVIAPGKYKVQIEDEDYNGIYLTKIIDFEKGKKYSISPILHDKWDSDIREYPDYNYKNKEVEQVYINMSYGKPSLIKSSSSDIEIYSIRAGYSGIVYSGKGFFHSLNYQLGGSYSYAFIPNLGKLSPQQDIIEQHYSYLTYDLGVSTSLYFNKYHGPKSWRPTLEMGIGYSLPLIFRYISRDLTGKYSERWIHKFNDVQLFGKFGFQNGISLFGNYRVFDVVRKNYPQLPKVSLGVSVTFQGY